MTTSSIQQNILHLGWNCDCGERVDPRCSDKSRHSQMQILIYLPDLSYAKGAAFLRRQTVTHERRRSGPGENKPASDLQLGWAHRFIAHLLLLCWLLKVQTAVNSRLTNTNNIIFRWWKFSSYQHETSTQSLRNWHDKGDIRQISIV